MTPLVLASTSTTRQNLLHNAGLDFVVVRPEVDEGALIKANPQWIDRDVSHHLAKAKSIAVSRHHRTSIVIGADQVLSLNGVIYSKPQSIDHCRRQLQELRGSTHKLISTVSCCYDGTETWSSTQSVDLKMRNFSDQFLENYLSDVGERARTSVGGYQVESLGIQLFDWIEGDYFTILGLPLLPLLNHLRFVGAIPT